MEIALLFVGAGILASVIGFSYYSLSSIKSLVANSKNLAVALVREQNKSSNLVKDILLWADENNRLKGAIQALESSNAHLLKNSKLTPSDVIDTADDRVRGVGASD